MAEKAANSYQLGSGLLVEIRHEKSEKDGKKKKVSIKVAAQPGMSNYEGVIWSFEMEGGGGGDDKKVSNIYGRYLSDPSRMFEPPLGVTSLDEVIRLVSVDSSYRLFDAARKGAYATITLPERTKHVEYFGGALKKKLAEILDTRQE